MVQNGGSELGDREDNQSAACPSLLASSSSSPLAPGHTPHSSHPSSSLSTPPSFATPPIPDTKTPFLRLRPDPHGLGVSLLEASFSTSFVDGATPNVTITGRCLVDMPRPRTRQRFHTPPLPSPTITTPFFVSKARKCDRRTPHGRPALSWASAVACSGDVSYGTVYPAGHPVPHLIARQSPHSLCGRV